MTKTNASVSEQASRIGLDEFIARVRDHEDLDELERFADAERRGQRQEPDKFPTHMTLESWEGELICWRHLCGIVRRNRHIFNNILKVQ